MNNPKAKNLINKYSYRNMYVDDRNKVIENILNKTIIPHQVEIQPGPKGKSLCWLKCPYCYGGSSKITGEALDDERYVEIMNQIADGGVNKVIFAGYATDPLNYKYISNIVQVPLAKNQIMGFHTKAIKVSQALLNQITNRSLITGSYFSVSVDAGSNDIYNKVHGMNDSQTKLYDRVINNLNQINNSRKKNNSPLDLSATYLLNEINSSEIEVKKFINDARNAGVDILRFTFPQIPRGYMINKIGDKNIPSNLEKNQILDNIKKTIETEDTEECRVIIIDYDKNMGIEGKMRTLPCFARWIFPSIGYDGFLGHCSESAAPHFREISLGNLNNKNFWELYYDYQPDKFKEYLADTANKMGRLDCRCDRKEHTVNLDLGKVDKVNEIKFKKTFDISKN